MSLVHDLIARNRDGEAIGLPCFCTANEHVLRAVLAYAARTGLPTVIEATCNQVNQDGGYTGMTPSEFMSWLRAMANEAGVSMDQLIIGGDHLGPNPCGFRCLKPLLWLPPVMQGFLTSGVNNRVRSSMRPFCAALYRPLASMVICGLDPNLPVELLRSSGLTGFSNPDLFDHFTHSSRRLLTLPVTEFRLHNIA